MTAVRLLLRLRIDRHIAEFEHKDEACPVVGDMGARRDPEVSGGDVSEREDDASRPDPDEGLRPMPVVGRQVRCSKEQSRDNEGDQDPQLP